MSGLLRMYELVEAALDEMLATGRRAEPRGRRRASGGERSVIAMTTTVDAFFYGLFMDEGVLAGAGVKPRSARRARLDGFVLKIGQRATLVRAPGGVVWGMVFALTPGELAMLYGGAGLELYRPEEIEVALENRAIIPARVYNLPQPPAPHERNPDYAAKLKAVLTRLGFPGDYIAGIQ